MLVACRWVHFASMAALLGGPLFFLAVAAPADWPGAARGTLTLLRVAAGLAVLTGLGWELAIVADIAGDPAGAFDPAILRAVLEAPFGPVLIGRLALLGALLVIVVVQFPEPARRATTAVVAGLLLVSQARLGHAGTGGASARGAAMMLAYACHVLAAAAWVGGLPPLLLVLREAQGTPGAPILPLLRHISRLATGAVAVLVAAGTASATFQLDSPAELTTTAYGRVLLVKLGLTAAMLAFAAYNRWTVAAGRASGLSASVAGELLLGALVLGAASVLGVTSPPM